MAKKTERSTLGVLYTGYLEKFNPDGWTEKAKRRFVVLTHVGLHWFKREEGYDLFGEEKGYVLVQEMRGVDQDASSPTQFYIETTDTYRRGFRASSKQECEQWVAAISCAIRNRLAYRRETLTGLSFLPTGDTDSIRPSILLASVVQGGSKEEVIVARAVQYGKLLSNLPDLQSGARVVFTLADGSTASIEADELQGGPKQVKAKLIGALSGHLLCTVSPESFKSSSANGTHKPVGGGEGASSSLVDSLLRPETLISVVLIAFLVTICVASAGTHPPFMSQVEHAAMLVTMLGLAAQILVPLLVPSTRPTATDATQPLPPVAIKVEEYVVEHGIEDVDVAEEEDADLENAANTIPKRFIDGMNGDMTEALRRWKETIKWRKSYGVSKMLEEPVPYFDLIKECYPHYYCMTGREGDPVYIERSGQVDQPRLRAAGCTVDMLVRHYVWCTEYLYTHLHPRETAKTITLFDVKGVGLRDLAGDAFDFLRKSASMIQEHYPERAKVILIVNTPGWFSFLWKMIKPFVHENTQKKVKILKGGKETFEGVCEFVDPKNIPVEYGGELTFGDEPDNCRWKSPEEIKMREYAEAVNKKHGVEMIRG